MSPSHTPARRRCVLVDDHQMVGQAVGGLLSELCNLELQAVCTSAQQAIELLQHDVPDLLILDLFLPGERWQDVAELFLERHPLGRIVVLSGMSEEFVPPPAIEAQVLAVVDKARAWQDLAAVISAWQADSASPEDPPNPSTFPATEHPSAVSAAQLPLNRLTPRELRVFQCLGRGLLNKEIAQELRLSLPTVETYRKNLSSKLGISGAELVRAAALHRCVSAGAPSA